MNRLLALTLLSATIGSAGCGQSDSDAAKDAVSDAYAALAAGDGTKFCGFLTASQQKVVVSGADDDQAGESCAVIMSENFKSVDGETRKKLESPEVAVTVQGKVATAKVVGANTLELVEGADGWLISSGVS